MSQRIADKLYCRLGRHGALAVRVPAPRAMPPRVWVRCMMCNWEGWAHWWLRDPHGAIAKAVQAVLRGQHGWGVSEIVWRQLAEDLERLAAEAHVDSYRYALEPAFRNAARVLRRYYLWCDDPEVPVSAQEIGDTLT